METNSLKTHKDAVREVFATHYGSRFLKFEYETDDDRDVVVFAELPVRLGMPQVSPQDLYDALVELVDEGVIVRYLWDDVTRAGISDEVRQPVVAYRYRGK